jgi:cytochrome oxidase Cu insertion factor (SCO1/SenC/PrrC family)
VPARETPSADPATVAKNFINQYGKAKFKRFIKLLKDGSSGEQIAEEYGVSRERVRQWKNAFGVVTQSYDVSADIQKLAK